MLGAKDWNKLQEAFRTLSEVEITKAYNGKELTVRTLKVKRPWVVAIIAQVLYSNGHLTWIQNFENLEALRQAIEGDVL